MGHVGEEVFNVHEWESLQNRVEPLFPAMSALQCLRLEELYGYDGAVKLLGTAEKSGEGDCESGGNKT